MKQPEVARFGRIRAARLALSGREWASIGGMAAFVTFLHVLGWGVLVIVIAPESLPVASTGAFGIGLGVAAYTLGLRHAFDADHIAAIDNITRKLCAEGKRSMSVGFWFSLGHSSIVFGLCALLAAGIRSLADRTADGTAELHSFLGLVGTAVSGVFLLCIGILNLVVLRGIIKSVLRMREGRHAGAGPEGQAVAPGFLYRVFGRASRFITRPWQVYGLGLLFGLGFDTATEVSLLILAAGAAASAPSLGIGSIELISILVERAGISTGPLSAIGGLDLDSIGYTVVALFLCTWLLAVGVWRFGHIEERWSGPVKNPDAGTGV
ncbi:high-affinity nickel-transport protein [Arthrobacter sp. V4I6]|uniref:HoxN/HupN/NixA family nickel/cobalt transporter n=1 Tax=unclassified Arthrobacter TaxID=235627 RepID=UPI002787A9A7|nr:MULTISPECIES: HoxN/HupN/NixA family nickel/cobalt transporter [unclassified Arthrobacter]MDQ0822826.1 high-affinity nickel-transport protein [Arthrobacter sp. V1I7]MDQ0852455.1 high-affinity nickel-transport protein [Arthrobacter sp. V4I6]